MVYDEVAKRKDVSVNMEKRDEILIKDLSVKFSENVVFSDFSLSLPVRKITCVLGPSGSGKTTLLKALAGLIPADGFSAPRTSFVFQDHRLLPHLTALDNLAVVLDGKRQDRRLRAKKMLDDMELSEAADLYPHELSGGMAQRVAIARGLLFDAELLLMDEPFKGLDLALQERLIRYFVKHWEESRRTAVFVTHSILEAILVADKIVVMGKGAHGAEILYEKDFDLPRSDRALGVPEVDALRSEIHDLLVSL